MTLMRFGKHEDKSVELVVLKFPDYVEWMRTRKEKPGRLRGALADAKELIERFDNKPFVVKCNGYKCRNVATRCSLYKDYVVDPHWWCDECDPYSLGAQPGRLALLSKYFQAIRHVEMHCGGVRSTCRKLIIELARAKGLPKRAMEKQAQEFLKSDNEWGV